MLPASFDVDRAQADVHTLVNELGPRPDGSPAERAAARYVAEELTGAGWEPRLVGERPNVVACKGGGRSLFIAHIDSVPGSPGAVDNAAGVGVLLELARTTTATDLCLAFVAGEETGLRGSRELAATWGSGGSPDWYPEPEVLQLVVALDLVGHPGTLTATGLGLHWGGEGLSWLLEHTDVDVPYAYRAVSRALPDMERSDHYFFQRAGARTLHLLHRNEAGIFPRYHQPTDTWADAGALVQVATALESMATAPPPTGKGDVAVVLWGLVIPAPAVWLTIVGGVLAGGITLVRGAWREVPGALLRTILALGIGAGLSLLLLALSPLAPTEAETTAAAVMGPMGQGWWGMAPVITGTFLGSIVLVRTALGGRGSAPALAALLCLLCLKADATVAFPLAVAALLALVHPLLALVGPFYLLRPSALRELAFHGLLPPSWWWVLMVLALPALGRYGWSLRSRSEPAPPTSSPGERL